MKRLLTSILFFVSMFLLAGCIKTPLTAATMSGSIQEINTLIDNGADLKESGPCSIDGYLAGGMAGPPLICAAWDGQLEATKVLLDRGADIEAKGKWNRSALWNAARGGHKDVVKLLIERGADVDEAMAELKTDGWDEEFYLVERLAKKQLLASQPVTIVSNPAQDVSPLVKSDIDQLPSIKTVVNKNAYAIVIGIEKYRQGLPEANFATADARTVTTYLTKVLGYPEENVVTLLNDRALQSDMAKYFEKWLPNNLDPGGTVFVYYSGHGAPNPKTGDAFLVPYDGDPAFIDETGYSLKRMYAALGKLPAKSIVVALDSCFSGAGGRSVIAKGTRSISLNLKEQTTLARNMMVLAASSGEQTSSTYDEKGHGLFTYFFLKGIKNEDVVAADGSLHLDDLFAYLGPQVERVARKQFNNEQTPQLFGAGH